MSIFVQAWVFAHSEAQLADRLVLLAIADEADDDGTNAYPSQDRIAHKARLSRSTVQRSIKALEAAGAIVVIRPQSTGRGKFNRYIVVMPNVQNVQNADAVDNPVDSLGTTEKGCQSDTLSPPERAQKGPTGDARPLDPNTYMQKGRQPDPFSFGKIGKTPEPATTQLGRGLDAEPLWDVDDQGNAVYVGPGTKPTAPTRTWT